MTTYKQSFVILQYQFDIILKKLQSSSIFIQQSLQYIVDTVIKDSNVDNVDIRKYLKMIRNDNILEYSWIDQMKNKFPDMEYTYMKSLSVLVEILKMYDTTQPVSRHIGSFWSDLWIFFLTVCFINPHIVLHDNNMMNSINIIRDSWDTFITQNIIFPEYTTLTKESLRKHDVIHQQNMRINVPTKYK